MGAQRSPGRQAANQMTLHCKVIAVIKLFMKKTVRPALATLELALIAPATLFLTALFVRNLQPERYEPAHTAVRIVAWFAARTHLGLWLFMIAFPLAVLLIGCVSLVRSWRADPALRAAALEWAGSIWRHFSVVVLALATAASAGILGIVVLHLITD